MDIDRQTKKIGKLGQGPPPLRLSPHTPPHENTLSILALFVVNKQHRDDTSAGITA